MKNAESSPIDAVAFAAALLAGDEQVVRAHLGHAARIEAFGVDRVGADAFLTAGRQNAADARIDPVAGLRGRRHGCAILRRGDGDHAIFVRAIGEIVERVWLVGPASLPPPPLLGWDAPHDPRMSQRSPSVAFDAALHPDLLPHHCERIASAAQRAAATVHIAERSEIAVCEAFSSGAGWGALVRLQAEAATPEGVVQFGAWIVMLEIDGAVMHVVDQCEAAARGLALFP